MHEMNVDETRRFQCREEEQVSQPFPKMEFSQEFEELDVPKWLRIGKKVDQGWVINFQNFLKLR
jgi:hypothetical protein